MPEIEIDMYALPSELVEQKIISGEGDIGFTIFFSKQLNNTIVIIDSLNKL